MFPKPAKGTAKRTRKAMKVKRTRQSLDGVWKLWGRWNGYTYSSVCAHCYRGVTRGVDGEVDHIRPRSVAPELKHDLNNLQILCTDCHRAKHHQRTV